MKRTRDIPRNWSRTSKFVILSSFVLVVTNICLVIQLGRVRKLRVPAIDFAKIWRYKPQKCLQVFGEPRSGVGFVRESFQSAFGIKLCEGSFHNFAWVPYKGGEIKVGIGHDALTIAVIRNPLDWVLAMRDDLVGAPAVLGKAFAASGGQVREIVLNGSMDSNVLLRGRKDQAKFYIQTLPSLAQNYMLLRYEDFLHHQDKILSNASTTFQMERQNMTVLPRQADDDFRTGRFSGSYAEPEYRSCLCREILSLTDRHTEALFHYPYNDAICSLPARTQARLSRVKKIVVVGQRQSGVEAIKEVMLNRFGLKDASDELVDRHLKGKTCLGDVEDVLFVAVVRDPLQWMLSMYLNPVDGVSEPTKHWWQFFFDPLELEDSKVKYNNHHNPRSINNRSTVIMIIL